MACLLDSPSSLPLFLPPSPSQGDGGGGGDGGGLLIVIAWEVRVRGWDDGMMG